MFETRDEEKKVLILESEALSASWYFLKKIIIKVYITTLYMEHFHSGFCTEALTIYCVLKQVA